MSIFVNNIHEEIFPRSLESDDLLKCCGSGVTGAFETPFLKLWSAVDPMLQHTDAAEPSD